MNVSRLFKGPQSALYGRRTFSGAINLITRKPSDDFSGYVQGTLGSYGNRQLAAGVSKKVNDMFSFRASGSLDNLWMAIGKTEKEGGPSLGGEKTKSGMIGLYFHPTENTDIALNHIYNENDDEHQVFMFQDASYNNCFQDTRPYYCGEALKDLPINIGGILENDEYGLRSKREHTSFQLTHLFDFGEFNWSSALNKYKGDNGVDQTYAGYEQTFSFGFFFGGPFLGDGSGWHTLGEAESKEISHEIRFSSTAFDDRLYWMIGGFYWNEEDVPERAGDFVAETKNTAIMGSVSYDFTDNFTVSLEARRSKDEIITEAYENLIQNAEYSDVENTFKSTTTRFIAEYTLDDHLFYFTRAEGNSPGAFNTSPDLPIDLIKVEEEDMVMYELGWKSTLLDGSLYISAAAFLMDWDNQQLTDSYIDESPTGGGIPVSFISNKGETEVKGFEFQGKYIVNENLNIDFGMSYTKSEFTEAFDTNHCRFFAPGGSSSFCADPDNLREFGNIAGNTPPQVPEKEATLAINYEAPINEKMDWFGRLSANYDSSRYAHVHNLIETGARTSVDFRAGIKTGNITFTGWVKNLTDDDTPTYVFRYIDAQGFLYPRAFPIAPARGREVGITAQYSF